jgi:hypothetical protein
MSKDEIKKKKKKTNNYQSQHELTCQIRNLGHEIKKNYEA